MSDQHVLYTPNTGGYATTLGFPAMHSRIDGDIEMNIDGRPLKVGHTLKVLMERLCMLNPSFDLHDKYPALKEAYDNYKMIEALCKSDGEKDE